MRLQASEKLKSTSFTMAINTAIYAVDDLMGTVCALPAKSPTGVIVIESISILDKSSQNSPMVIVFITTSTVGVGTNNSNISIPDASLRSTCRGCVAVSAGDYKSIAASSVASKLNLNMLIPSSNDLSPAFFLICKGTPTYGAATDLVVTVSYYVE